MRDIKPVPSTEYTYIDTLLCCLFSFLYFDSVLCLLCLRATHSIVIDISDAFDFSCQLVLLLSSHVCT